MKKKAVYVILITFLFVAFLSPISIIKAQQPTDPLGYGKVIEALLRLLNGGIGSSATSPTPKGSTGQQSRGKPTTPPQQQQTGNTPVMDWARKINAALERGLWRYFNKQQQTISNGPYSAQKRSGDSFYNVYWCTHIIIDAYNLAGFGGLNLGHQSVFMMRRFLASNFRYLDYRTQKNVIRNARVGDIIVMQSAFDQHVTNRSEKDGQHVALINGINVDNRCNGYIDAIQANGYNKTQRYLVDNCNIDYAPFPVVAFAGK